MPVGSRAEAAPSSAMLSAAVLTVAQHYRVDAAAAAGGVPRDRLMEAAGEAVAAETAARWAPRRTLVLCGPGDNGGDGYVVARRLAERGWPVVLCAVGGAEALKGPAALAAARWTGATVDFHMDRIKSAGLVVDALFGAGLTRPLDGLARAAVQAMRAHDAPVVSIDTPSGVLGDSAAVAGIAPRAALTVTFIRPKPAHLLLPGRALCGEIVVADIGAPESALAEVGPSMFRNLPPLWLERFNWPGAVDDKYARGHAVVDVGPDMPGAARLALAAARRAGAGVATVACAPEQTVLFQIDQPGALVETALIRPGFEAMLAARRRNALVIGPGAGVSVRTGERTISGLNSGLACVVDADALTVFEQDPEVLFRAFHSARETVVITPHEGEFAKLFPDLSQAADLGVDKASRARAAASRSGAVVVLKGADAVVAAPDGSTVFAGGAPPWLATAGSGDVLAGLIGGLRAQGLGARDAACAGCWLHMAAARRCGIGLIAEDLPDAARAALADLRAGGWARDDPFAPRAAAATGDLSSGSAYCRGGVERKDETG